MFPVAKHSIAAVATPFGTGGIGIIKISGPDAVLIVDGLFRPGKSGGKMGTRFVDLPSHRLIYGCIHDPEDNQPIDEVLVSVMRAPRSYTGEDVVEINVHAGLYVQQKILDLVLSNGASPAEPGEFTLRAFLNGRIDLTRAEAVMDIIAAKSDKAAKIAARQIKGTGHKQLNGILQAMLDCKTRLEASIDFPEDMDAEAGIPEIKTVENSIIEPINKMIAGREKSRLMIEGCRIAIAGKPNVGKSTLLNCLTKSKRAIVTPYPGTTRDIIEVTQVINGVPVTFMDTAGIHHKANDPVEKIGVAYTQKAIKQADGVIFMVDVSRPLDQDDDNMCRFIQSKEVLLVANKKDLLSEDRLPGINYKKHQPIYISAKKNKGLKGLEQSIVRHFLTGNGRPDIEMGILLNQRQERLLSKALNSTVTAKNGIKANKPAEIISLDMTEAIHAMEQILGIDAATDVLGRIFSRFCIGK